MKSDKVESRFEKREAGYTLEEIAQEEGISRQAVHDSLIRAYGSTDFTTYLTPLRLSQLLRLPLLSIIKYRRGGIIQPINTSRWRPLYGVDAIEAIRTSRSCQVCGAFIPSNRLSCCSPECMEVARVKARARCRWRIVLRNMGKLITPCNAYVREPK